MSAVETARVSEAAVDYDEHSLLREARRVQQQTGRRSLGNFSLDKFTDMYKERAMPSADEYSGMYRLVVFYRGSSLDLCMSPQGRTQRWFPRPCSDCGCLHCA